MDFIIEIIANLILLLGVFLFQWGVRHKQITLWIFAIIMIMIDVFVLLKVIGKI